MERLEVGPWPRPGTPVVYYIWNHSGSLIYIGASKDLLRRIAEHRRSPWFGRQIWEVSWQEFEEWADAREHERFEIGRLDPEHNTVYASGRGRS